MPEIAVNAGLRDGAAEYDDNPAIRPRQLRDFTGQEGSMRNLEIFMGSARRRGAALDHTLLSGPPGLGKTTIAQIIANEMGAPIKTVIGPALQRAADIASILVSMEAGSVFFIDEIHRLSASCEEMLYSAMEDYRLDLITGDGATARAVSIPLERFTLVGATTRAGALSAPLTARFGIQLQLELYNTTDLTMIIQGVAEKMGVMISAAGAAEIADRARGTPRIAGRLLRRVHDFAVMLDEPGISATIAAQALSQLGIDRQGLDDLDRRYLGWIRDRHAGGPVGIETISAALGVSRETLEDVVEPYLIQQGFIARTSRGRMLPQEPGSQLDAPSPNM